MDDDGNLSSIGFWYVDHVLSGEAWKIRVAAPGATEFRFWVTDSTTIFVVPHPELEARKLLGYCPSNDLFRLLLAWAEATPSWPFDMHLELSRAELRAKLEQNVTPGHHPGDVGEFLRQRWTYMSLSNDLDEPFLNWVHTETRGDAVSWVNPSLRNIRRLVSIRQDHDDPFWLRLVGTIAGLDPATGIRRNT